MFRNYFVIAARNLLRQKSYSFLNIAGLAIGMAACLLILIFVQFELSYDKFHFDYERIHRVVIDYKNSDGSIQIGFAQVAPPYGRHMREDFPEVEYVSRIDFNDDMLLKVNNSSFIEDDFCPAEKDVLNILSIPILQGDRNTCLENPGSLVLSQSMAKKIFGDKNPIGEEVLVQGIHPFTITAVMGDLPANSHVHFNFFVPFEDIKTIFNDDYPGYYEDVILGDNFGNNNCLTYVKLHEGVDPVVFDQKIRRYIDNFIDPWTDKEGNTHLPSDRRQLKLQNIADIHLTSKQNHEMEANGDILYVKIFGIIAGFILLIACINYINMSTARSLSRAREVGLRKVIGANRFMLIHQFLGESLLIIVFSLLLALLIITFTLPPFANFVDRQLTTQLMFDSTFIRTIIAVFVIVGISSGLYPAFYLSAFRPTSILRGEMTKGKKGALTRRILVVSQFVISACLIICVSVVFSQLKYMKNKDLGFDKENVLIIQSDVEIGQKWQDVKKRVIELPGVVSATASKRIPSGQLNDWFGWKAEVNGEIIGNRFRLPNQRIDFDFFKTYGMEIAAGRAFDPKIASDTTSGIMLNEIAVKQMGWENPQDAIGATVWAGRSECQVIGVVKDFYYESLRKEICPIIFYISPRSTQQLSIRLAPGNVQGTIADIQNIWDEFHEGSSAAMSYKFLDEHLNLQYPNDQKLMILFTLFSALAILISCIGLIALSAFTTERRSREIGIRKVLGASVTSILGLLSSEYSKLVFIGAIIAAPISWYSMRLWLNGFAYHTELNPMYFIIAGLTVLFISFTAVLSQTLRAASSNPSDVLRQE